MARSPGEVVLGVAVRIVKQQPFGYRTRCEGFERCTDLLCFFGERGWMEQEGHKRKGCRLHNQLSKGLSLAEW